MNHYRMGGIVSDDLNPWLSRPTMPEVCAPPRVGLPVERGVGPQAPQRGVPAPDHVDRLPTHLQSRPAPLWWLGAHGGAGESTLASLVPEWSAAGHGWPQTPGAPSPVVVVARSNMRGLRAAQIAATQWASGLVPHAQLVGLVIVADAPGRLPRPLREFAQIVAGGFPRTWHVPWVEAWRFGESPDLSTAPRDVRRLVDDLKALPLPGAAGTTN